MAQMVKAYQRDKVLEKDHEEETRNEFLAPVKVDESAKDHDVCSEHERNDVVLSSLSESGKNGFDKQIGQD